MTASASAPRSVPSTDGVTLVLHDLGGDGPPVLLAHATGFHAHVWEPLAAHLGGVHSYAPDFRGHGDASAPADLSFAWDGFGDDVLAIIDALGLDHVRAAGHSMGGAALLLAEQRRPGTFASLYLFEPIVMPPIPGPQRDAFAGSNPLAAGARRRRPVFDSFDAAYDNYASKAPLNTLDPAALRAYVDHGFAPDPADPAGPVHLKCRPEVEAAIFEMGGEHDGFSHLAEVTCPVVVARGAAAPFSPAEFAPAIVDALPHARLEEHPDLGHFGPLEAPGLVAEALRDALFPTG